MVIRRKYNYSTHDYVFENFDACDISNVKHKNYNLIMKQERKRYTVDLVIFACLNFREFLFLRLFTKFRIRDCSFFFSSAILKIIFASFLSSRICPPREIRENKKLANITRSTVSQINLNWENISPLKKVFLYEVVFPLHYLNLIMSMFAQFCCEILPLRVETSRCRAGDNWRNALCKLRKAC